MPQAKRKIPPKSAKRVAPPTEAPAGRNAVNFVLTDAEHTRLVAEVRQLAEQNGLPALTLGKYGKHALLSHNRLRRIEAKIRGLLQEHQTAGSQEHHHNRVFADRLRLILETPVAGG